MGTHPGGDDAAVGAVLFHRLGQTELASRMVPSRLFIAAMYFNAGQLISASFVAFNAGSAPRDGPLAVTGAFANIGMCVAIVLSRWDIPLAPVIHLGGYVLFYVAFPLALWLAMPEGWRPRVGPSRFHLECVVVGHLVARMQPALAGLKSEISSA